MDCFPTIARLLRAIAVLVRFERKKASAFGVPFILVLSGFIFPGLSGKAQILHSEECFPNGSTFTLDWSTVGWTPAGSTTFNLNNFDGSATSISYNVAFSVSGETGSLTTENGVSTPGVTTSLSGGTGALHISSTGLNSGEDITLRMSFTPAIAGRISFDIYNIIQQSVTGDDPGQNVLVYAQTAAGFVLVPELVDNGSPSWDVDGPGVANGNTGSTSGTNDQVGVNIQSLEDVTDVYVRLKRCTACGLASNTEFAIGDLFFCLIPDTDQDGTDDFSDQDDDNDGIYDNVEKCPNPSVYTFDWDNYSWGGGSTDQFAMPDGTIFTAFAESNGAVAVSIDINSNLTGGYGSGTDGWFFNADQLVQSQSIDVIMDFSEAIDSLSFRIFDVDALSGQYTDSLIITGYYNGFVVFPTLTGSTYAGVNVNRAAGTASVADNLSTANVLVEFDQPLDSVAIFYTNGVSAPASPGNQWITIHDLTYKGDCGSVDSDGDGYDDYLDIDADNDGIVDYIEWQPSTSSPIAPAGSDSDADGIDNNFEASLGDPTDTDGDGIPDFRDPDSDDDGDLDMLEAYDTNNDGVANTSATGTDADEDGLDDGFDNHNGWNSTSNVTNGGQTSGNLPNLDDPVTAERDWREQDSDGDGVQDYADLDDDNDGIPDTEEVESGYDPTGDEDGDGIPNFADTTDNGGSGDGSSTSYTDSDADGAPDAFDQDEDGIRNQLDIDVDNDGITDLMESGIATATIATLDTDNNGIVDAGNTFGNNGLVNTVETSADNGTLNYTIRDTDADGVLPNFLDIDSDDDGIVDYIEAQATTATPAAPSGSDSDSDGLDNTFETGGLVPVDTDGDGTPDYYDTDSDDDTDTDALEGYDTDNDGTANTTPAGSDTDLDGLDNNFDNVNGSNATTNVTNNGQTSGSFPNLDSPGTTERDWRETPPDTDGDGTTDNFDNDCDNDGIPDSVEGYGDSDGDGLSDACDADSDNDGIPDIIETGGTDTDGNGQADDLTDNDGDGIPDIYDPDVSGTSADLTQDCSGTTAGYNHNVSLAVSTADIAASATLTWYLRGDYNQGQSNENITVYGEGGTNLGTYYRTNSNITNYADCGTTPMRFSISISAANWNSWNGDGQLALIFDAGSGVNSSCTDYSCLDSVRVDYTFTSGTPLGSVDTDGDGVEDRLDLDADNDGITDIAEAGGVDTDGDGRVDNPTDSDFNGISDEYDVDNGGTAIANGDTDADGINDMLDLDADNDGIPDVTEAGGTDANGDGYFDDLGDTDGDGLADDVDGDVGNDGTAENSLDALVLTGPDANNDGVPDSYPQDDEDSDGIYNHIDLDSDGDGIPDVVEAGGTDANGDGFADDFSDTDSDGFNDELDGSICSAASGNGTYLSGSSTGITNGTNASGASDGAFAQIHDTGDLLVLDFGQVLPVGTNYTLTWRRKSSYSFGATADMRVEESSNNSTYSTNSVTPATTSITTFVNTVMTTEVATRYLRLSELTGTNDDIDFDAVAFSYNNCVSGNPLQLTGTDTDNDGAPNSYPEDDFDGDGVRDQLDRDSDNDGIPDVVETGGVDTDGDGRFDDNADTDNDGLADDIDGDVGNNGVAENTANALQVTGADANSDGAPDSYSVDDTDGDGHRDQLDLDSDNDGIPDVVEAGGVDTDGDGYLDNQNDTDDDGFADDVDGDVGNDAVAENTAGALQVTGADADNNGSPDTYPQDDADNDGLLNQLDIDADNDGITDVVEAGGTSDANGRLNAATTDTDGDGFGDGVDGDVGNDGTAENSTGALCLTGGDNNNDGAPDSYPNDDQDEDGYYNFIDIDADDDGIVDNIEAQATAGTTQPGGLDADGDGLDNNFEAAGLTPTDTDGDGTPDYLDNDSDNDGYTDLLEGWDTTGDNVADTSPAGTDIDGDGLDDSFDNVAGPNNTTNPSNNGQLATDFPNLDNTTTGERDWRELQDTDSDGVADNTDLDDDNDGIPDEDEAAGNEPDGDEDGDDIPNFFDTTDNGNGGDGSVTTYTDVNGDGIPDIYDFDRDGVPNHLDKDGDNDGIADIVEAGGTDANQDGEIDYPTPGDPTTMTDADNDGLSDNVDDREGAVTGGTPLPEPNTDGAGGVNYLDIDADDDGIVDLIEGQASTGTPIIPLGADSDGDGIDNAFDTDNGGTYIVPENTDGTDTPDYIDLNSDNDGENDLLEGWDTDGDGTADNSPAGSDTDSDGLDNNFDLVNGINATSNVHNNGQNSGDFPNADAGSAELDWREQPCFGGVVTLAPNNDITVASDYCVDGGWTYYYDPTQPTELLFAIQHKPAGGNTNDFTASAELTVSGDPLSAAGVYGSANVSAGQATFVMGRYWNLQVTSGLLNGAVNIRFFYDPAEADMLETTAEAWNDTFTGSTPYVSGRRWFMVTSGSFDHASPDLLSNGVQGSMELFPSASGTEDGETYTQFDGLTSLTGGGLAYSIGTNSVVLPVELLSFDAQPFAYHEVLTLWTTATEINSDRFEIERSANGVQWSRVGEVAAAGNSAEEISYEWIDRKALAGRSYYRIRQVDQDGKYQYSQVREVEFTDETQERITVFPNPGNGLITLFLGTATPGEGRLEVYNAMGQLVISRVVLPSQNSMELDLSLFGAGVYSLQFSSVRGTQTLPVIVE